MSSGEDVILSVAIAGFISLLVVTLAPAPLKGLAFGQPSPSWAPGMTANWFRLALIAPCATLATYALPVIVYRAGSIGKQSRALVVMRTDGHRPSLRKLLLREWLYKGLGAGSGVVFGLAALTGAWSVAPLASLAFMDACLILFSLDGRTLGDRIFGTRVPAQDRRRCTLRLGEAASVGAKPEEGLQCQLESRSLGGVSWLPCCSP